MRNSPLAILVAMASLLAGCASIDNSTARVGPNPADPPSASGDGILQVFSKTQVERDGNQYSDDPIYYQHRDYKIYDNAGKIIRHVGNMTGEYSERPASISLPPGTYTIKGPAKNAMVLVVPVTIKPGLVTGVHLDGLWKPATTPKAGVVTAPAGYPIGWKSE